MLFDAHARAFEAFGGVPQRGIYDNMKTAVDQVLRGKKRKINNRFEVMTGHYLFEPEFCNVASGWEKGIVEKNVRDRRCSIWSRAKDRRWADWAELNSWLAEQSRAAWSELNHPEYPALKVADALQDEQAQLMPVPRAFDGYVELLARVSSTGLIHMERNRYSVPTEHAHSAVSLRIYPDRIAAVADGVRVATHSRSVERSQIIASLKQLKLHGMAASFPEVAAQARHTEFNPESFMHQLIQSESAERCVRSTAYQMGAARFPAHRDLAGFAFEQASVDEALVRSLHSGQFTMAAHNAVLIGGLGTGKTHLATAIGVEAIQKHSKRVRFFSTVELVNVLELEKAHGKAGQIALKLMYVDLVVLDELGYLPFS